MEQYNEKQDAIKEGRTVGYWNKEIKAAVKREKDYRKNAKAAVRLYEAEETDLMPYNILFSNTSTLIPALYSNLPTPVVKRRFTDKDVLGRISAKIIGRYLSYFMDDNDQDHSDFDTITNSAVEEALVPGRGLVRFKYDADFEGEGDDKVIKSERVYAEEVPWDRVYFGYAKLWHKVPWFAIESCMDEDELKKNFPKFDDYQKLLVVTENTGQNDDDRQTPPKDIEGTTLARIYEIWDKYERKVYFICPDYVEEPLKVVEDPLKLDGFFPIPKPLMFGRKISSMLPIPLYNYYKEQAEELNIITVRIRRIIKALKVRGFYDGGIGKIEQLLEADDNKLIAAENVAALHEGKSLDNYIWLMPIEKLITVVQQLYVQREQIKSIIQELSGIADIMRGNTKASETLGAQQLKNQWGGVRIDKYRKMVEYFLRDCLRLAAEIAFKHMQQATIAKITNTKLLTKQEKMVAEQRFAVAATQKAQMGQPPPPRPDILDAPTWEEVMALCKDDLLRNYKLDVETNSTVSTETLQDKSEINELIMALSQFFSSIMPLVQSGMLPVEAFKTMMMSIVRRYKFGSEVEDEFEKMQAPQPPPEAEAAAQKGKADAEAKQLELQSKKLDMELQQAEVENKKQKLVGEAQLDKMEFANKMAEIQRKGDLAERQYQMKLKQIAMKARESEVNESAKEEA